MRNRVSIVGVVLAGLCACSSPSQNGAASNSAAAAGPPPCDMTASGNRTLGEPGAADRTPERIREVARLNEEMVGKAKACAEQAGYSDVQRMVSRPSGSHLMDANNQWFRTTEETWIANGSRDGQTVPVVVTSSGRVEVAPAVQAR